MPRGVGEEGCRLRRDVVEGARAGVEDQGAVRRHDAVVVEGDCTDELVRDRVAAVEASPRTTVARDVHRNAHVDTLSNLVVDDEIDIERAVHPFRLFAQ